MFDTRELATILAALLFWSEEISPSGNDTARHYLKSVKMTGIEPLTVLENKGCPRGCIDRTGGNRVIGT